MNQPGTIKYKIQVFDGETYELSTIEESLASVKELREKASASSPFIFNLIVTGYGTLNIGVGHSEGVFLQHIPDDGEPPYKYAVNAQRLDEDDVIVFDYFGSHTELLRNFLIEKSLAFHCIKRFLETGTLTNKIDWVEA